MSLLQGERVVASATVCPALRILDAFGRRGVGLGMGELDHATLAAARGGLA